MSVSGNAPPPLSLYVHLPWCIRKCPYCDFNSHALRQQDLPEDRYLKALLEDLETALPEVWGRPVISVFFGGGTPSLFSGGALESFMDAVRSLLPLAPGAEVTLEANPGTVERARFADFRRAGINRLSLGIQSFHDHHLAVLGRIHDGHEARRAVEWAMMHFDRVNLDLMYGLPGQTLEEARADVQEALSLGASHLSCYQLTLEPNTPFAHSPPVLPAPDQVADMEDALSGLLQARGLQHYEISAYARPGHRCTHNLNYWTFGDYLGIGAGAHGKLTFHDGIVRQMRHRHPEAYMAASRQTGFIQESHEVPARDLPFEFMMNALRLCDGVEEGIFQERTGLDLKELRPLLLRLQERGWLSCEPGKLQPTRRGQQFLNDVLQQFLPESPDA